jgi:FKBP-type peptidyl-prolyl cis-trans isomerase (trigger factor)
MTGQTIAEVAEQLRPDAEASAREELALKAYADREKVVVGDEELDAFVHEQAQGEQDPEEMERRVLASPAARESVREELRLKKALDRAVEVCKPLPVARTTKEQLDQGGSGADGGVGDGQDG